MTNQPKMEVEIDGKTWPLVQQWHFYKYADENGDWHVRESDSPLPTRPAPEAALKLWREKQKKPEPTLADEAWEIEREAMDRGEYRVADLASLLRRHIERGGEVKDSNDIKDALKVDALETLHNVIQERDRLAAELERAKAIIDKLPKTADGVPIVPEENYYAVISDRDEEDDRLRVIPVVYVGNAKPWVDFDWCTADEWRDDADRYCIHAVYSTEAAALAAKEQS